MAGYRFNERNIGDRTLDSEPKRRSKSKPKMTIQEIEFAREILQRVYESLEYDEILSKRGHLHPESKWTDGGRFALCVNGLDRELLFNLIHKRKWA